MFIKKYDISILEENEIIEHVLAESIDDAKYIIENRINIEDLILEPSNYNRYLLNANSKELTENINIYIRYNADSNKITIITNKDEKEYTGCYTVRDLGEVFKRHCINYLEDEEIEAEQDYEYE